MKYKELVYSRTKNLGNYESERTELRVELDEGETVEAVFNAVKGKVLQLQDGNAPRNDTVDETIIPESVFSSLTWKDETGAKLGAYQIALVQDNDKDLWQHAYDILSSKEAVISKRFHEESYRFSYWLYDKMDYKIFRQQLKEAQK